MRIPRPRSVTIGALIVTVPAVLAACSSGGSAPTAVAGPERIQVVIADREVTPVPSVHTVHLGREVLLTVTGDQPDEVHVHGYDKEVEIAAGKPGTIDFTANLPGIFEVETHKSGLQLLQIEVK